MAGMEIIVADDPAGAALEVATRLAAVATRGGVVALSGGSTPRRAYELAAELEPDWSRTEVWLADERCVPEDHEWSNARLVRETLVAKTRNEPRVSPVDTSLPPTDAASAYDAALRDVELDLVLLGVGKDGHTASLFPDAPSLDAEHALAVAAAPGLEPWVERVTLTIPALAAARHVVFLAVGDDKAMPARRAFRDPPSRATPASLVRSATGVTVAVLDATAARLISNPAS
jgi:6-phosphogluconolactonase